MIFTIPGDPVPQGRPRFFMRKSRRGDYISSCDPVKSTNFKGKVALFAKRAGVCLSLEPIKMTLDFYLPRPKALFRKKDPEGAVICPKRPDMDNLVKAVLDGLNGVAYKDDGQVVDLVAKKYYHGKDGAPGAIVTIEEL